MDLNQLPSTKKVCTLFLILSFQLPESIFTPNGSRKINAIKANQNGGLFPKETVKALTGSVIRCDVLSFILLLAHKEYYKWGSSYGFTLIYLVYSCKNHSVFHLAARHKMIPYFPEDNIPWTEEKHIPKLVLEIPINCLISFQNIEDLLIPFNLPRLIKLFPAFQKKIQL